MHSWNVTPKEAIRIQRRLAGLVVTEDEFGELGLVCGVDIGFEENNTITRAAAVLLSLPDLVPLEYALARQPTRFPYVPGLLSFREVPAALDALDRLSRSPDLIICDGHGRAHPRRFGLACHLGVYTGIPTIGVAKSRLVGNETGLGHQKGAIADLVHHGELIGHVVRTRDNVRPVYVSLGHKVSLVSAVAITLSAVTKYRLPETTRWADRIASNRGAGIFPLHSLGAEGVV